MARWRAVPGWSFVEDVGNGEVTWTVAAAVAIICTDRGQHKRTRLTTWVFWESDPQDASPRLRPWADRDDWTRVARPEEEDVMSRLPRGGWHGAWSSRDSFTFRCPRCSRTPRRDRVAWLKLMEDSRRVGAPEFDVSHID